MPIVLSRTLWYACQEEHTILGYLKNQPSAITSKSILPSVISWGIVATCCCRISKPPTAAQRRYNRAHIKTRSRIEQCFGVTKKRFHALAIPLRTRIDDSMDIIVAIACMHNLAFRTKQPNAELSCDQISEPEHRPPYDMQNREPPTTDVIDLLGKLPLEVCWYSTSHIEAIG